MAIPWKKQQQEKIDLNTVIRDVERQAEHTQFSVKYNLRSSSIYDLSPREEKVSSYSNHVFQSTRKKGIHRITFSSQGKSSEIDSMFLFRLICAFTTNFVQFSKVKLHGVFHKTTTNSRKFRWISMAIKKK